jgi:hypothetical protein
MLDPDTEYWASTVILSMPDTPTKQYPGHQMYGSTWSKYIIKTHFPSMVRGSQAAYLMCSPGNIIACFQQQHMLEGLALVVAWGGMVRTARKIYREDLPKVEQTLLTSVNLVKESKSIRDAWGLLVGTLGWSNVMTSKYLHFLARSLGFSTNPPVALDNQIVLNKVWPAFHSAILSHRLYTQRKSPYSWGDGSWEAYNRYMTVINCWASQNGWTTTELENTLFGVYG